MIKVCIVDDEPFIRQGLKLLIDWNKLGFEVAAEAANGVEALTIIKNSLIDLVITDIKMPEMNGLELIENVKTLYGDNIKFIVLSGFYEFEYAKKAIKFGVKDYVLKPIQKQELTHTLEVFNKEYIKIQQDILENEIRNKISYDIKLNKLLSGEKDVTILEDINKKLKFSDFIKFILIDINNYKTEVKDKYYKILKDFIGNNIYNILIDIEDKKNSKSIGLIIDKNLICSKGLSEKDYIKKLYDFLSGYFNDDIYIYVGSKSYNIADLKQSYEDATMLKIISSNKKIILYEDLYDKRNNTHIIKKHYMDNLISAIEENDNKKIVDSINEFYDNFKDKFVELEMIKINIDYLIFNLINIEKDLNSEENKVELLEFFKLLDVDKIVSRESKSNLTKFSFSFANYLNDLRKNSSKGILSYIDKEIYEHYMDKLSLKSLSEKYYLNSAYLGQIFKKKYNVSFKDYLNEYRIEKASELLKRSDEKIYKIAENVGYNNTDYFINKFLQIKGKTPYQYRKQFFEKEII